MERHAEEALDSLEPLESLSQPQPLRTTISRHSRNFPFLSYPPSPEFSLQSPAANSHSARPASTSFPLLFRSISSASSISAARPRPRSEGFLSNIAMHRLSIDSPPSTHTHLTNLSRDDFLDPQIAELFDDNPPPYKADTITRIPDPPSYLRATRKCSVGRWIATFFLACLLILGVVAAFLLVFNTTTKSSSNEPSAFTPNNSNPMVYIKPRHSVAFAAVSGSLTFTTSLIYAASSYSHGLVSITNLTDDLDRTKLVVASDSSVNVTFLFASSRILFVGNADASISALDLSTTTILYNLTGHTGTITCLTGDETRHMLVSCSADNSVNLWNTITMGLTSSFHHDDMQGVNRIGYTPNHIGVTAAVIDGSNLYTHAQNAIWLWNIASARLLWSSTYNTTDAYSYPLALSKDRARLYAGVMANNTKPILYGVLGFTLNSDTPPIAFSGHWGDIRKAVIHPTNQTRLFTAGFNDTAILEWDTGSGNCTRMYVGAFRELPRDQMVNPVVVAGGANFGSFAEGIADLWIGNDPDVMWSFDGSSSMVSRWYIGSEITKGDMWCGMEFANEGMKFSACA
ncbi:hypothetical protein HK096_000028 [Nowakowskiella sp. JEL0078]|nr:hypothetical protein HK096_000028 [Nowakowskiella sp. JEL0078]